MFTPVLELLWLSEGNHQIRSMPSEHTNTQQLNFQSGIYVAARRVHRTITLPFNQFGAQNNFRNSISVIVTSHVPGGIAKSSKTS
jgi:hypothetical protein